MPVCNVLPSVTNSSACAGDGRRPASVGRRVREDVRVAIGLDEHVDQLERAACCRTAGGRLRVRGSCGFTSTSSTRSGSLPGLQQLVARCAVVQREIHPAVRVGRRGLRGHDPRREAGEDRCELAEPTGDELDVVALGQQDPLRRPEEAGAVRHAGLRQHGVVAEEERAAEHEPLPVVALPQRREERVGVAGPEPESDRVARAEPARPPPSVCTSWSSPTILARAARRGRSAATRDRVGADRRG